jgi:hypothetical protein
MPAIGRFSGLTRPRRFCCFPQSVLIGEVCRSVFVASLFRSHARSRNKRISESTKKRDRHDYG